MKNLAIFYGGKSTEHDISIITALQVMNNIDKQKYKIVPIYIHNDNTWHILDDYLNINIYAKNELKGKRIANGFFDKYVLILKKFGLKKYIKIDIAINCCHGLYGEDGTLSGLLELNEIPYVGSGVLASSIGMDKVIMKDVFVANNIPCVKYIHFSETQFAEQKDDLLLLSEIKLKYPIIVKPANLGSSIGINISKNRGELIKNIEIALNYDKKVILEEVVPNLREINCSVIGNVNNVTTSILEEPKNWKTFLNFDEKYLLGNKNGRKKTIDVKLKPHLQEQIKTLSKKVFQILGCSGVVRIDYLLDDELDKIYVNEINTVPGSFANYLWQNQYAFSVLLDKLLEYAQDEYICKSRYIYAYKSTVLSNYKRGEKVVKLK